MTCIQIDRVSALEDGDASSLFAVTIYAEGRNWGLHCPAPVKLGHIVLSDEGVFEMARERHSDEEALKLLREIEVHLAGGMDVPSACRQAGISDATSYTWRKKFGGMARPQLAELKALE